MNKNLKFLVTSILLGSSVMFAGCGFNNDEKPVDKDDSQIVEDEGTSENSTDKDNNADKEEDKPTVKPEEKPVAKPEEKPVVKPEEKPVTKPEEAKHSYNVYYLDETASFLKTKVKEGKKEEILKPWSVLWQVQDETPLNKNTKVNSFTVNNSNLAVVDVSSDIYSSNVGSSIESLMLEAMAKTFMSAYGVDGVILTVDGKLYQSGHILMAEGEYFK